MAYNAKLKGLDMMWLSDMLVEEKYRSEVYCPNMEGITNHFFSPDARRWLALVGRRIHLSANLTDVTYHWAPVVVCAIQGIQLNVKVQVMS